MTIQEFIRSTLFRFAQEPDNQRFGDDIYSGLNDAQNDIANRRKWGFLRTSATLTTVADTRTVSLPTDFGTPYQERGALRITSPSGSSGDKVQLMTFEEWTNNFYEDGTSTGEPTYAYIMGASLYFSPIPDAAYQLSLVYYKRPTSIESISSDITIPTAYHELLKRLTWLWLQDAGYSPVQEMQITEDKIKKLIGDAARDDVAKYGGFSMNLDSADYKRRTV